MTDELHDRLHASDPAASLPPADPERVARLLEDVMSTELTTENRETGTHGRGPLTWLVAAAAAVIIAGVGIYAVVSHDDDPAAPPTAAEPTLTEQTVTDLTAPDPAAYVREVHGAERRGPRPAVGRLRRHRHRAGRRRRHPDADDLVRRRADRPGRGAGAAGRSWRACCSR